jgi:hypothetical protein
MKSIKQLRLLYALPLLLAIIAFILSFFHFEAVAPSTRAFRLSFSSLLSQPCNFLASKLSERLTKHSHVQPKVRHWPGHSSLRYGQPLAQHYS